VTAPGTFERVYAAIKRRLREGAYRPGARLEPAMLSDELNASVTPVRDALHRLTGERLVEAPRHEGFRAPMMTESTLRHLYAWHLDLLLLALARRAAEQSSMRDAAVEHGPAPNAAFARLAALSGNPEHWAAFGNLTDRLEPFQRFESDFLEGTEAETEDIARAIEARDQRQVRRSLILYHRRRQKIVPDLLESIYRSA
jgi:DNA-binding GntR family transcriptional regulator